MVGFSINIHLNCDGLVQKMAEDLLRTETTKRGHIMGYHGLKPEVCPHMDDTPLTCSPGNEEHDNKPWSGVELCILFLVSSSLLRTTFLKAP